MMLAFASLPANARINGRAYHSLVRRDYCNPALSAIAQGVLERRHSRLTFDNSLLGFNRLSRRSPNWPKPGSTIAPNRLADFRKKHADAAAKVLTHTQSLGQRGEDAKLRIAAAEKALEKHQEGTDNHRDAQAKVVDEESRKAAIDRNLEKAIETRKHHESMVEQVDRHHQIHGGHPPEFTVPELSHKIRAYDPVA